MPKNIFLTGFPGSNKTTIIKRAVKELQLKPGGFMTARKGKPGGWVSFQMLAASSCYLDDDSNQTMISKETGQVFAFRQTKNQLWHVKNEIFNNYGVELIEQGLRHCELIIMDELGRFELGAKRFQQQVEKALLSPRPVLGVIKYERNQFIKRIWDNFPVEVIWVDKDNQDWAYQKVIELLSAKE